MPTDVASEQTNNNRRRNYGTTSPPDEDETDAGDDLATAPNSQHDDKRSTLSFLDKFGFGLGHIYNDLCAGVWFSYMLLFMQGCLRLPATEAGVLVMIGQVCDALSTPVVGYLTDRYGTKRKWHIFGTALVFLTFPMIFSVCPWCTVQTTWWPPVYFSIFILLFQFAWPVVQVTHLAMIPEMSVTTKDRADLTATRYSASICANVIVYVVTWAVLQGHSRSTDQIGPRDSFRFRDISLILTLIGVTMSVLFQFSLALSGYERRRLHNLSAHHQPARNETNIEDATSETARLLSADASNRQRRRDFLRSPALYQNAFLYVFSRLFMTTSLVYMPLWLDERSRTPVSSASSLFLMNPGFFGGTSGVQHLATVPLVSFLSSFVSSMLLKHVNHWIGHSASYMLGSLVSLIGCVWIVLAAPADVTTVKLYSIAAILGAGSSITMISSLCIIANMIGQHTQQGGFIYSAVTFADKLITGIIIVIIEASKCENRSDCPMYYRDVLGYVCGAASILGLLILLTLRFSRRQRTGQLRVQ